MTKPLELKGIRATVDETGVTPKFKVSRPGVGTLTIFAAVVDTSSHFGISGFTVRNALGEGILIAGVTGTVRDVSVTHNTVVHNDLGGGVPPRSKYFECAAEGQVPGDCGEGVHFLSVAHSEVSGNYIAGNAGGVLLTDETGPTHDNVVQDNTVTENAADCGITVPGDSSKALSSAGKRQPKVAGVYSNLWSSATTSAGTTSPVTHSTRHPRSRRAGRGRYQDHGQRGSLTSGSRQDLAQFPPEVLRAAVGEAHRLGLAVTAHAHAVTAIADAVAAGVDGLEHVSFWTEDGVDAPVHLIRSGSASS